MTSYAPAAEPSQDDWLSGLMVSETPEIVTAVVVPEPLPPPVPELPTYVIPTIVPPAAMVPPAIPVPPQPPVVPTIAAAIPAAPAPTKVAPPPSENWLALVMPDLPSAGASNHAPVNAGPSLKERLGLQEKSMKLRAMIAGMAKRIIPMFRRQVLVPFVCGAATMFAGETAVRYFVAPKPPQPNPVVVPVEPVVKPASDTKPVTTNTSTSGQPAKPDPRPSPWDTPAVTPPVTPSYDWMLPPGGTTSTNTPGNQPSPWSTRNDLQNLVNPAGNK